MDIPPILICPQASLTTGFRTGWEVRTKQANIWFEPHAGTYGSLAKDKVELLHNVPVFKEEAFPRLHRCFRFPLIQSRAGGRITVPV
jgi:hypothetical protein